MPQHGWKPQEGAAAREVCSACLNLGQPLEQGECALTVLAFVRIAGLRVGANEEMLAIGDRVDPATGVDQATLLASSFIPARALLGSVATAVETFRVDEATLIVCRRVSPSWLSWRECPGATACALACK